VVIADIIMVGTVVVVITTAGRKAAIAAGDNIRIRSGFSTLAPPPRGFLFSRHRFSAPRHHKHRNHTLKNPAIKPRTAASPSNIRDAPHIQNS
jgi:hypothetical protein